MLYIIIRSLTFKDVDKNTHMILIAMFMLLKKNNHNNVMYWQGACKLQTYRL